MVTELEQTSDPRALVPGNPAGIAEVAGRLYNYATLLNEAGSGLGRIDTAGGWRGAAADAFRARFHGEPGKWLEAGSCFLAAAKALDDYVPVLAWAQQEASDALTQWHAGNHQSAQQILDSARSRVANAAGETAAVIGRARDQAPQKPGFWSQVGGFFSGALQDAENVGADVLNGVASFGNAMLSHPGDTGTMLGGALLMGVGALGDAGGAVLDATGVGAIAGVPVNALSTAGVVSGATLMAASGGDLARHAAGDDSVDPVKTGGDGGSSPQDPRLTPGTPEYDQYTGELAKDPAHGGKVTGLSKREAAVAAQAEADGDLPGPVTRTPLNAEGGDEGDFTDSTGQKWEVKSSPDVKPDYSKGAGQPIPNPQTDAKFTEMIDTELGKGQKVLLDPHGMTATRLAHLQELVAGNPEWEGQVTWGR